MDILDIHTHHAVPQPQGIVAVCISEGNRNPKFDPTQRYSIGIHPWDTLLTTDCTREWETVERYASEPEIVAIGETGIDLTPRGGPMFRQLQVFKRHIGLSERLCKPLVIHDVKGHDIVVGARRDLKPTQPWAIHGFRGKPEVAEMLVRAGCMLSFGAEFNPETLRNVPPEVILAETDAAPLDIAEVIARLSDAYGSDLTDLIKANTRRFLGL